MPEEPLTVGRALELIERHQGAIERLRGWLAEQTEAPDYVPPYLTPAQRAVASVLHLDVPFAEAARRLGSTAGNLSKIRQQIYTKLGVRRRRDAVVLIRLGRRQLGLDGIVESH